MAAKKQNARRLGITFAAVLALLLSMVFSAYAYFAHKQHIKDAAIAAERAQYAQAEKDLDQTAALITAKFGPPDDNAKDKSCGYTSNTNEFEKGDLYCNIQISLLYSVSGQTLATSFTKQIEASLGVSSITKYEDQNQVGNNIIPIEVGYSNSTIDSLDCTRQYTYVDKASLSNENSYVKVELQHSNYGLLISMSCSDTSPKEQLFPIKD